MKNRKAFRRLTTLLLVVVALFMLSATALATSVGVGTNPVALVPNAKAAITVGVTDNDPKSANANDTLYAYKVVDIVYNDSNNSLTHTFTANFVAFKGSSYGAAYSTMTVDQYCELSDEGYKALLGAFTAYLKQGGAPYSGYDYSAAANNKGVATFPEVAMGQYIVVGAGTNGAKIYQSVTVEVAPEVRDGEYVLYTQYNVEMKTSKPSINKDITGGTVEDDLIETGKQSGDKHTIHNETASIGDDINYRLDVTVPTYPAGSVNKTFYIGDVLSAGLSLVEQPTTNIVVKGWTTAGVEGTSTTLTLDDAYTVEISTSGTPAITTLYIDFDFDKIAAYNHITVDYVAELNENAVIGVIGTGNPNNATLVYSTDPFSGAAHDDHPGGNASGYGEDKDMEIVYTYGLVIDKFEEGAEDIKLADVTFVVKNSNGDEVGTITTDENGVATLTGLKLDTYSLEETVAPSGYKVLAGAITGIQLNAQAPYSVTTNTSATQYTYTDVANGEQAKLNGQLVWINSEGSVVTGDTAPENYVAAYLESEVTEVSNVTVINKVDSANGYYKVKVANVKGPSLPSTGGMGTTIFVIIGSILVAGSAILLITKKRMSKN